MNCGWSGFHFGWIAISQRVQIRFDALIGWVPRAKWRSPTSCGQHDIIKRDANMTKRKRAADQSKVGPVMH
ncbi:MAG: hypothetical protein ABTQ31_19890 [Rhizobiaceae bacterium]